MKTFYVHYSITSAGPFYTVSFKTRAAALRAILEAMRAGEGARLQVA